MEDQGEMMQLLLDRVHFLETSRLKHDEEINKLRKKLWWRRRSGSKKGKTNDMTDGELAMSSGDPALDVDPKLMNSAPGGISQAESQEMQSQMIQDVQMLQSKLQNAINNECDFSSKLQKLDSVATSAQRTIQNIDLRCGKLEEANDVCKQSGDDRMRKINSMDSSLQSLKNRCGKLEEKRNCIDGNHLDLPQILFELGRVQTECRMSKKDLLARFGPLNFRCNQFEKNNSCFKDEITEKLLLLDTRCDKIDENMESFTSEIKDTVETRSLKNQLTQIWRLIWRNASTDLFFRIAIMIITSAFILWAMMLK